MKFLRYFCLLYSFIASVNTWSQSADAEVTITATRYPSAKSFLAVPVTVISSEELEHSWGGNVSEAIRSTSGIDVVSAGGSSGQTSVFIRGAQSHHVLVLIDGLELNDPSQPNRGFDLSSVQPSLVEKIEIIKGPQSGLYGSDAMAGVINIITKKKQATEISLGAGSNEAWGLMGRHQSSVGRLRYGLGVAIKTSRGLSASKTSAYPRPESDGSTNINGSMSLGFVVTPSIDLEWRHKMNINKADIDDLGVPGDDPNNTYKKTTKSHELRAQANINENTDLQVYLQKSHWQSQNVDLSNDMVEFDESSEFIGRLSKNTFQVQHLWGQFSQLSFIFESEVESMKSWSVGALSSTFSKKEQKNTGMAIVQNLRLEDLKFNLSLRGDQFDSPSTHLTYRFATNYEIKKSGVEVHSSLGTGFKRPSLYQLFEPTYGSLTLKNETSKTWELGVNKKYKLGSVALNYFDQQYFDLIGFQTKYINIQRVSIRGIEFSGAHEAVALSSGFLWSMTYLNPKDHDTGKTLLKRPRFSAKIKYNINLVEALTYSVSLVHIGDRADIDPSDFLKTVTLGSYTLTHFLIAYRFHKQGRAFFKIHNLFSTQYEESAGYTTPKVEISSNLRWVF